MKYLRRLIWVSILTISFFSCEKDTNVGLQNEQELEEIRNYLEANNLEEIFRFSSSGYFYKILELGDGDRLSGSKVVYGKMSYKKFKTEDKPYYSNFDSGELLPISLQNSIPIITQLTNQIRAKGEEKAGRIQAIVPSKLAFGEYGSDLVPKNTILEFELEIEEVYKDEVQFTQDTTFLATAMKKSPYDTFTFELKSGIYYKIEKLGEGDNISSDETIQMNYQYFDFREPSKELFRSSGLTNTKNLPRGFQLGLSLLRRKGAKATFVIPSTLAFGIFGNSFVKPKTILIIEVEN